MLNNLNQFKWQITPNPNEKQREREREREIHKICSKKRKWKRKPGGADQLERGDRKSDGAKGWGVLRVLSPFASEVFFSSIPLLLPFLSLSLSLSYYSLCLCVCVSLWLYFYVWMNVCIPSFLPLSKLKWRFTLFVWSEFPSREPTVQLPPPPLPVSKLSPSPFLFYYFLFLI